MKLFQGCVLRVSRSVVTWAMNRLVILSRVGSVEYFNVCA